eukprot:2117787-Alexandrium_andersonii.AAC.1
MRAAGCTQTVLVTAMHILANGEVATPEWVMAAAMRVWGARSVRLATEVGPVSRVLLQRNGRRTERKALLVMAVDMGRQQGVAAEPPQVQ